MTLHCISNSITFSRSVLVPGHWTIIARRLALCPVGLIFMGLTHGEDDLWAHNFGGISTLEAYREPPTDAAMLVAAYCAFGWLEWSRRAMRAPLA